MKPFNLQCALAGDLVVTRNGRIVLELYHFKTATTMRPLRGVIEGKVFSWDVDGVYNHVNIPNPHDLFMAPTQRVLWLNIEPNGFVKVLPSRKSADKFASPYRFACVKVTYTEGEGL